ncbi:MAG: toll/interleukin-1 receptor domain-containing protein [Flavisolibacter sp.]
MIKIFISHCWADKVKPQFGQIQEQLGRYELWIDKTELKIGENLNKNVKKGIEQSEIVLVLWSENAAKSSGVQYEIKTAVELNKTILPCMIDDHPLSHSEELKDMLCVDLRDIKKTASLAVGWMRVNYFLTDFYIDKISSRLNDYSEEAQKEVIPLLKNLRDKQETLKYQINEIRDTMQRIKDGAEDRNQNNPYVKNMMNRIITDLGKDDAGLHQKQIVEFMQFCKEILEKYPGDDNVSVKIKDGLMLQKIHEMDPEGKNDRLSLLREGILNK